MSYVESNLVPGETLIYQTRLHWVVMLWHLVLGCFLLVLPGVLLLYSTHSQTGIESQTLHVMEIASAVLLVCGVVVILVGMVRRNATEMAVTNRRVVIGTGGTPQPFHKVAHPLEFRSQVQQQIEKLQ
jgi:hypothetical protein